MFLKKLCVLFCGIPLILGGCAQSATLNKKQQEKVDPTTVSTEGTHLTFEYDTYACDMDETFVLPVPEILNGDGVSLDATYIVKVYDGLHNLLYANVKEVRLSAGVYSIYYALNEPNVNADAVTLKLTVRATDERVLCAFNDLSELSKIKHAPLYNFGTQTEKQEILPKGYQNSVDGVLKITSGEYEDAKRCRDGFSFDFEEPIRLESVRAFRMSTYQDISDPQGRIVIGFYTADGVYAEFWYNDTKKSWINYEINVEALENAVWKKWNSSTRSAEPVSAKPTTLKGVYMQSVFCVGVTYVDSVSVVEK